jgi:hypothetical protein
VIIFTFDMIVKVNKILEIEPNTFTCGGENTPSTQKMSSTHKK